MLENRVIIPSSWFWDRFYQKRTLYSSNNMHNYMKMLPYGNIFDAKAKNGGSVPLLL